MPSSNGALAVPISVENECGNGNAEICLRSMWAADDMPGKLYAIRHQDYFTGNKKSI
jgi:hypothetical protein